MIANRLRPVIPIVLAAAFAAPLAAGAQAPSYATKGETIHGTIESVQNVNHLFVEDDRGYTDDVTLRAGASVVSSGVHLEPGQRVTIQGSAAGNTFLAARISTNGRSYSSEADPPQFAYSYPVAVPVYYPAPVYYASPAYYGYGPFSYGYGFGFSFGYRYRGYQPYYGRYGGYGHYGGYRPVRFGVSLHFR
jgi:hypothetical protein